MESKGAKYCQNYLSLIFAPERVDRRKVWCQKYKKLKIKFLFHFASVALNFYQFYCLTGISNALYFRHYDFDLDKTVYLFSAGRYEFMNKGADMFIEALARLNHYLQATDSDKTVIAFLIFPTRTNNFNVDSLRGQAITKQLRDTIHDIQNTIGKRLYEVCLK